MNGECISRRTELTKFTQPGPIRCDEPEVQKPNDVEGCIFHCCFNELSAWFKQCLYYQEVIRCTTFEICFTSRKTENGDMLRLYPGTGILKSVHDIQYPVVARGHNADGWLIQVNTRNELGHENKVHSSTLGEERLFVTTLGNRNESPLSGTMNSKSTLSLLLCFVERQLEVWMDQEGLGMRLKRGQCGRC